ncbi:hypothetical protein ABE85_24340 [Mitsuaria sp. 7]|nr:hypothetical protein ABE85_24340 [Mitsuaria sp. 7]
MDRRFLLLSLQRALLGEVHPQLRQASIEADPALSVLRLRFEYDGSPEEEPRNSCSCAAAEVIADFDASWALDEQHVGVSIGGTLSPLAHVGYLRFEEQLPD